MRNSGIHLLHVWRVFPSQADEQGNITFTLQIDGQDQGELKAETLTAACIEARQIVEKIVQDAQK